jgi:hypothetical protein
MTTAKVADQPDYTAQIAALGERCDELSQGGRASSSPERPCPGPAFP